MKVIYVLTGSVFLFLGVLGIFLPLLPTTPFLLLSAALYMRGSDRLYDWLLSRRIIGEYIRNFRETKAIPLKAKIVSVSMIWVTMFYCILLVINNVWLRLLLIGIALAVTVYIFNYRTLRKE